MSSAPVAAGEHGEISLSAHAATARRLSASHVGTEAAMKNAQKEWSRYYHDSGIAGVEVLDARFVGHRYPGHAHDYSVIALVENGAASYWYRGASHVAPAGHVCVINPGEPHTGESAKPDGYFYQTIYPRADYWRVGGMAVE